MGRRLPIFNIGVLSERTDVSTQTIRYYERSGYWTKLTAPRMATANMAWTMSSGSASSAARGRSSFH